MAPIPAVGILAATVPGMFDGLLLALTEHGTMSFAQVSAPAIEYAAGFPIGDEFANFIRNTQEVLELWPASRDFFLPGGRPPVRGEIFREPTLARTLEELAAVGEESARRSRRQVEGRARSISTGARWPAQDRRVFGKPTAACWLTRIWPNSTPRPTSRAPPPIAAIEILQAGFLDARSGDARSSQHARELRSQGHGP